MKHIIFLCKSTTTPPERRKQHEQKVIAIILSCIMLVSASPVVAAEDATVKPTVEEILNEYHQKSFEAQQAEEQGTAATYSRQSGSGSKTLEQETVNTLNAAGYEAYNVTADNYDSLEAALKSDFEDMGLDKNGSYIVVISSEDGGSSNNPNSRLGNIPEYDLVDPGVGGYSSFEYTYNGKTYKMRYVTVTPTENQNLGQTSDVELLEDYTDAQKENALNLSLTLLSYVPVFSTTATILSLLTSALPNANSTVPYSIDYRACSAWTTTYTQVYHSGDQEWRMSTCVEYVTSQYFIDYTYYNPSTNLYEQISTNGQLPTIYSEYYNDKEYMKQIAAYAFEHNAHPLDTVDEAVYKYNGEVVITHQRWAEPPAYEPA